MCLPGAPGEPLIVEPLRIPDPVPVFEPEPELVPETQPEGVPA